MRTITWLQISDFHLRESQAWAQDVVLSAMCEDIARRRKQGVSIDFVLATGDLAFAGKANEYDRVRAFFDQVVTVTAVPRERIFCIPGNHDVDRDRQKMCFAGARHVLQNQNEIDLFLGSPEEVETLSRRQDNFYRFQESYLSGQERAWTSDHLGYVSTIAIENLRVAIVGLNTAWLAEGGLSDHGKLIAGERQVIDALRMAREAEPHLVISMGHHPFRLLNEFDRRPVQRRIEEACQFFHCGHLHDPEAHDAVRSNGHCLTVAAGASFDSRHTHNAYSIVSLDVMQATSTVETVQYRPTDGTFLYESKASFPLVINTVAPCSTGELGRAVELFRPALSPVAYYLSALLLEAQAEVPIGVGDTYAFGSVELLEDQPDAELKNVTLAFMRVRNPLRLFGGGMPLDEFLARYGADIERFGATLETLCGGNGDLRKKLEEREVDARNLAGAEPMQPFTHTLTLLRELAQGQDWDLLRELAERHLDSKDMAVAAEAKRMLALCMAQSAEEAEKKHAVELYRALIDEGVAISNDVAALASVLITIGDFDTAKTVLIDGMGKFPEAGDGFLAIGQKIVESTGDRQFRDELDARRAGRRTA